MDIKESKDAAGNLQMSETDVMIDIAGCYIMRNVGINSLWQQTGAQGWPWPSLEVAIIYGQSEARPSGGAQESLRCYKIPEAFSMSTEDVRWGFSE